MNRGSAAIFRSFLNKECSLNHAYNLEPLHAAYMIQGTLLPEGSKYLNRRYLPKTIITMPYRSHEHLLLGTLDPEGSIEGFVRSGYV